MRPQATERDRRREKRWGGDSAVGLGHELNNPLQNILVTAEDALRILDLHERAGGGDRLLARQLRSKLEAIVTDAERGGRVVRRLVDDVGEPAPGRRPAPEPRLHRFEARRRTPGPAGED